VMCVCRLVFCTVAAIVRAAWIGRLLWLRFTLSRRRTRVVRPEASVACGGGGPGC
jgi:hypothetical protein